MSKAKKTKKSKSKAKAKKAKKNPLFMGILVLAVVATGGAAWLSAQANAAVGAGNTVQVLRTPT